MSRWRNSSGVPERRWCTSRIGGATPAITALLRGEISLLITNLGSIAPHVNAGKVRTIASVGAQRPSMRPDLPTVAESGLPGFSTGAWWGLYGPANLPHPIFDKVRAEALRILNTPEARKLFETNTFELMQKSPDEFAQFIREDLDNWGKQIQAAGIKPD